MFSFLFLLVVSSANGFSLTVLHTNDNHGRIEETDTHGFLCFPNDAQAGRCFGGMARRATMIKRIRAREKNVLLLCGGDVLTGTPWYKVYRGNASRKFMNELGYNAMALGNHEFDDGIDNLVSFLSGLNFTVVSSNLNVSHEPKWPRSPPLFVRSKVLEVGGQKIGIVGYVLKSTRLYTWPGPGPNIKFLSEVESVRSAVKELQRQNINKIIAVGHSGIEVDKQVATEVDGVDIVVGGHSNTFLYKGTPPSTETPYGSYPLVITPKSNPNLKALVVQDFAYGKYLGHLKVEFDENGNVISWSGNPILLNNSVPKDSVILQQVLQMKTEVAKMTEVKVGSSFVFLNGSDCMWKECNLGNVITDAFVFHYANQSANDVQWTDASIAVQHGGSIPASIPVSAQDNVTYGHIANIVPYKALVTVDVVEFKGRDMLQLFERLASKFDGKNPSDSFLQVSGLQITYDIAKTPGKRVVDFKVRCAACQVPAFEPLDKSAVYKVILTSMLARNSFVKEKRLSHRVGITDDMAIVNYFKARSPVSTGVEGRITFADTKVCGGAKSLQTLNMLFDSKKNVTPSKSTMLAFMFVFSFLFSSVNGFSLIVLHTNDNHGRFEETDTHGFMCFPNDAQTGKCFGGMARRATIIKQIRSQEKNVLLLSGGDVLTGTLWYTVYRGNATRDFMNKLGYDATALGNHEFDDGIDNLVASLNGLNFTVVSSNLNVSQEPKWPRSPPLFVRSKVLEVGGQKIGIVGYVLENTPLYSRPGPGPNIKFLPEVESVRSAVEELKQNNINKIIAVGHSGIEMDKRVAREVDGVDIVVGGHTNTFLYTGTSPSSETPYGPYPLVISKDGNSESKALVVQDFAYGKYLGRLKVEFDDNGRVISWSGNPILLDSKIQKDPIVYKLVQQMKGPVAKVSEVKVGSSFVFLDARRPDCFLKECNLGNVVTDAFVFHYANQSANNGRWTDASIAIQSSGSITASIDVSAKDAVTYGHIVNSCPYKNTVDVVELKGKHLLQVFEQVASLYDENKPRGSFLQVSGLQITYDMAKASSERVVDIKVRCATCQIPVYKPLNESAIYKVILSSYLARGGAGFGVVRRNKLSHRVGSVVDNVVVMNYFKAKSPILTGIEGRIKFIQGDHSVICSLAGNLSLSVAVTFVAIFSPFVMRIFVEP